MEGKDGFIEALVGKVEPGGTDVIKICKCSLWVARDFGSLLWSLYDLGFFRRDFQSLSGIQPSISLLDPARTEHHFRLRWPDIDGLACPRSENWRRRD